MNRLDALWAIDRAYLDGLMLRADGRDLMAEADPEAIEAMYAARGTASPGAVGVVPIYGPMTRRDTLMSLLFGGTSTVRVAQQVNALAADESIGTILMLIDSPGGQAAGVGEAAAAIRNARQAKPVVALTTGMMGSAAAWLGWQASEVIASPDAMVGSQGVFGVHVDTSKALEMAGIKPTYIASSDAKVGGNPGLPLDDETRAEMQALVDETNRLFVADTAEGRGITPAQVREQYGNGSVFHAREAKKRGMVDRIESYSQAIARLSGVKSSGMRAEDDPLEIVAAMAPPSRGHMMADPPKGHGMSADDMDGMSADDMEKKHRRMHSSGAGHDHADDERAAARFELDRDAWAFGS